MSDYTPETLLEQNKFPLFPFYMLNYKGKDPEKFEREWQAGCTKLADFVKNGYMEKAEAEKLVEGSRIVIEKTGFSDEKKEVLKKMTMFDKVGVGTDWIELKRREDERIAKARVEERKATAKIALAKGLSLEDTAELANLPIAEIEALVES